MPARPIGYRSAVAVAMAIIALMTASSGCSGYRHYGRLDAPHLLIGGAGHGNVVEVGELVRVRTTSGIEIRGRVESLGPAEFLVGGKTVPYSEIESVQVRSILWAPTVVTLGTVAFLVRMITLNDALFSPHNAK